ncbi:MAG TPA: hypothetical protein VL049_21335 [Candidatus Dormibacteraeota bacterium]|nr:hypothetical protein [Candidatus Dormibacteraeota bacterium]
MKPLGTLTAAALLAATMLASPMAVRAEDLAVDPSSWNFGEVAVGTSVARSFGFTSIGTSDVSLYLLQVTPDEVSMPVCGVDVACDFAITSSPGLPRIMPPGDTDTVEVTFTPSAIGPAHAFFYVRSNDTYPPPGSIAYLPLTGVGVEPVPPAPVPAASPWALVAMALALTGAAAVALKRMAR